ncbi:hypothetical protein Y1Q_0002294 [Alligator mississippiensis]|uniref:DDE Tnp4 domain-containing protein n=1 Tax=Alligator mississippiensis TaxID=8496 RepID=A0A151MGP1_ALLMI|nr:hypothetical protein Y1Q_0002294 [Alligator mississippiensis]
MSEGDQMEIADEIHEKDDMENPDKMSEETEMGEDKMELSLLLLVLDLLDSIEAQIGIAMYAMMILVNSCNEMPAGWDGFAHDALVFRNFPLPGLMEKGYYAPGVPNRVICGVAIPPFTIADVAYPLKPWLMKPYGGHVIDLQKMVFNYHLSKCRMAVEYAFGYLRVQWRVLNCS